MLNGCLILISIALLLPVGVLLLECCAACLPSRAGRGDGSGGAQTGRATVGVLIPAHDEAAMIEATLASVQAQLAAGDRLCVVADNCTDQTAELALAGGAEVVERNDAERRGKGFALDAGLGHLQDDPPEVVVILDADCLLEPDAIDHLVRTAVATQRPVQGRYLMTCPDAPGPMDIISQLAVTVKNHARPRGLTRLGVPCLLTGSGMAFPWPLLVDVDLANGHIVEDMQLGYELTRRDRGPVFCEEAGIVAALPAQTSAAITQRTRWEHGHLQMMVTQLPRLLGTALRTGRLRLVAVAADLCVPPLSVLVLVWTVALAAAVAAAAFLDQPWTSAILLGAAGLLLVTAVHVAWFRFAREQTSWTALAMVPLYVLAKVPIYLKFLFRRQRDWVRTSRAEGVAKELRE